MFRKSFKRVVLVAIVATIAGYVFYSSTESSSITTLAGDGVESVAACESIGWWDNEDNCVSNDKGDCFCKTDSWQEITDCKL